jgi:hypothetical protein
MGVWVVETDGVLKQPGVRARVGQRHLTTSKPPAFAQTPHHYFLPPTQDLLPQVIYGGSLIYESLLCQRQAPVPWLNIAGQKLPPWLLISQPPSSDLTHGRPIQACIVVHSPSFLTLLSCPCYYGRIVCCISRGVRERLGLFYNVRPSSWTLVRITAIDKWGWFPATAQAWTSSQANARFLVALLRREEMLA